MKEREAAVRTKRYDLEEKSRKVADLEKIIRDFELMALDLDRQIMAEEDRTGVRDRQHFAYSTFAKSAAQRRDNLKASIDGLLAKLELAKKDRDDAAESFERASAIAGVREDTHRPLRRRLERSPAAQAIR